MNLQNDWTREIEKCRKQRDKLLEAAQKCMVEFDRSTVFDANSAPFDELRAVLAEIEGDK